MGKAINGNVVDGEIRDRKPVDEKSRHAVGSVEEGQVRVV